MKNFVLSVAPLSANYKSEISNAAALELQFITLSELKKLGVKGAFRFLFNEKADHWIIATEDSESNALFPVLHISSLMVSAKKKFFVDPNLQLKNLSNVKSFFSGFKLAIYTIYNFIYKEIVKRKLLHLTRTPPEQLNFQDKKKALYLNANLWYGVKVGGSIGHVAGVINGLEEHGCEVIFAATSHNPIIKKEVPTHILSPLNVGLPPELNHYRFSNQILHELSKIIEKQKPDFIYQRLSFANYTGVILSRKFKLPLVLEYNGSEVWCAEKWGSSLRYPKLALLAENVCLQHAARVVTISEALQKELLERGVEKNRITYYPNCVDTEVFNPERFSAEEIRLIRQKCGILTENALVFTFIGTFGLWHGVDFLAHTIVELVAKHKHFLDQHCVHFMLIGDGPQAATVKRILTEGGALDYCILTGLIAQSEAASYLAASDVFLSPTLPNPDGSVFFGSPTKLFEYMAMGKAIIASDLAQIGEILKNSLHMAKPLAEYNPEDSQVAMLCTPGKQEELLNAICFLSENPQWRTLLGKNARKMALEKYTWRRHVEETILLEAASIKHGELNYGQ